MEVTKLWAEHKKLVINTAIAVTVALVLIRFFDIVFLGLFLTAVVVAAVIYWTRLVKKHGSAEGVWKSLLAELGVK